MFERGLSDSIGGLSGGWLEVCFFSWRFGGFGSDLWVGSMWYSKPLALINAVTKDSKNVQYEMFQYAGIFLHGMKICT